MQRLAVGAGLAALVLLGLAALSQWEYTVAPEERAELRLAWRARVPRVDECRRLTPEEQAELPAHMRREEVCEGRVASYRLAVSVDGQPVRSATVAGAGARGDRPLYVFETIALPVGPHSVEVSFTRLGADHADHADAPAATAAPPERSASTVPDRLVLREAVELGPREVALVTYDPERRRLELRRADR